MKFNYYIFFLFCFLFNLSSFGQVKFEVSNRISVSLENLSVKNDSAYTTQIRSLEKNGYRRIKDGRWLNEKGEEMLISLSVIPKPPNGFNDFDKNLRQRIQANKFKNAYGSLVFNVTSKGDIVEIHSLNKGSSALQKLITDLLLNSGKWSGGIESGSLSPATFRLTVTVE